MSTQITESGPEQAAQFEERAKARLAELQEQARAAVAERPELGGGLLQADAAASQTYSCPAKVVFTGALVWERIQVCCDSQPPVNFTSDIWGLSVAFGGIVWGTAWFSVPPSQLPSLGSLSVQCNIRAVEVDMSWWKDGTPIGTFIGGGVGIGAAILGGTGEFKNGGC
ncbi:MAG TPA: hypothetical protein VF263_06155 [Longimicrobiaceae bacterium]